jgi:hypothetical protein
MHYIHVNINIIKHIDYQTLRLLLPMSFLDLDNDLKSIISKHVTNEYTKLVQCPCLSIMIYKKIYLARLNLMTISIKLKQHLVVFLMMMMQPIYFSIIK